MHITRAPIVECPRVISGRVDRDNFVFSLRTDNNGTELLFAHRGFLKADDAYALFMTGWGIYLASLKQTWKKVKAHRADGSDCAPSRLKKFTSVQLFWQWLRRWQGDNRISESIRFQGRYRIKKGA
jgi:hypothetical protein